MQIIKQDQVQEKKGQSFSEAEVMSSWTTRSLKSNGIDMHYLRTGGNKPPIVLLHGLMLNGACWTSGSIVSTQMATELAKLNQHLEVAQITEAGHAVPFDQPERFSKVVQTFLRSLHT